MLSGNENADQDEGVIYLNVGGVRHETLLTTLQRHPETLLANLKSTDKSYRPAKSEFFYDRHPGIFTAILNYYRTGELHCPKDVCGSLFAKELGFWAISEEEIKQCCWVKYNDDKAQKDFLDVFDMDAPQYEYPEFGGSDSGMRAKMKRVWLAMEYPTSSNSAFVCAVLSFLITLTSITLFCVETLPGVRSEMGDKDYANYYQVSEEEYVSERGDSADANRTSLYPTLPDLTVPNAAIDILDTILMTYFIVELIARFTVSPFKRKFFLHAANIFDVVSILPLFIELIVEGANKTEVYKINYVDALFFVKLFRILRLFRVLQNTKGYLVFVHTMRASWRDTLLLLACLTLAIVFFGSLIYIFNKNDAFTSIPKGFWWAIVTMTTVGYGEMVPSNPMGYLVGSFCTVTGVLLIAFTVPSIVNNYLTFYSHVQYPRNPKVTQMQVKNIFSNKEKPLSKVSC